MKLTATTLLMVLLAFTCEPGYASQTWTIVSFAGPHGTISPCCTTSVNEGENQTFVITPDQGYSLDRIYVDYLLKPLSSTYTFENVTRSHLIEVYFRVADLCYSSLDTCYVCYDTTQSPWVIKELDLGVCDTVRIGCPICIDFSEYAVGDSFPVPVYVYNDYAIESFRFGFRHDGLRLRFSLLEEWGWDPTGGVLTSIGQRNGIMFSVEGDSQGNPKQDSGSVLMGWVDFSNKKPIAPNTTNAAKLMGSIWMTILEQRNQNVEFDSTVYPPAATFGITYRDSVASAPNGFERRTLTPRFVMCTQLADPPCDINFGIKSLCGDVNLSGNIDISDIVYLVTYMFANGPAPLDTGEGDADCDGRITIADAVYFVNYVFYGGLAPCEGCR